ncbi:MAG: FAD-dependent thymidylate synthase [bacterium]|nr:FAD-dependent thymidylate synthase [bacterium]
MSSSIGREAALTVARHYYTTPVSYGFTDLETAILAAFVTNVNRRVFLLLPLPPAAAATLGSMYSRLNNPRGLRGIIVDQFLPAALAGELTVVQQPPSEGGFGGDAEAFLRQYQIKNLAGLVAFSSAAAQLVQDFVNTGAAIAQQHRLLANSSKCRRFLNTWLDAYGHNSIARTGMVHICCEGISLLAAKSLEWNRPGSGFIELSTRYVNMQAAGLYPFEDEVAAYLPVAGQIKGTSESNRSCFADYRRLAGTVFDGPLPAFYRERYASRFEPKDLERGIQGETCDVLGNLLPAACLTSVFTAVSGEALPMLIKHLRQDQTAENEVLAELIVDECGLTGSDLFVRHTELLPGEVVGWGQAGPLRWVEQAELARLWLESKGEPCIRLFHYDSQINSCLDRVLSLRPFSLLGCPSGYYDITHDDQRDDHEKLPRDFESSVVWFVGLMSFRGWRDLQRMGMGTHRRTSFTPSFGFYRYPKPHPDCLDVCFARTAERTADQYRQLVGSGIPPHLAQYLLPLGWQVGFEYGCNLRQAEFGGWQRSKFTVNDEVRAVFTSMDRQLREVCRIWSDVSRADLTPHYIFARTAAGVSLTD